ncbi:DNA-3-methyladenine glycosylase [uncultured Tyzzerella sp.]|uniref:DNA-3-methyladenine glycosylase n=1 Tax=uncultured Tyzzerella sp. TaxID=2321398 RepID=UPI00294390B2|nr:DNA-3-methyladenine glycosylase [uncultured Tyzzerella sp.]
MDRLTEDFFTRDALTVGRELIGKYLVRELGNERIIVKITETESYLGDIDKACHAYGGKITERTKTFYLKGGTIYVYLIYGMYYCFNVITDAINKPSAVLIRGAEPIENIEKLSILRYNKPYNELSTYQKKNFLNGPGKLCKGLNIDKYFNEKSILSNEIYILNNKDFDTSLIKTGKRINIDYAEEAKDFLWRFYI